MFVLFFLLFVGVFSAVCAAVFHVCDVFAAVLHVCAAVVADFAASFGVFFLCCCWLVLFVLVFVQLVAACAAFSVLCAASASLSCFSCFFFFGRRGEEKSVMCAAFAAALGRRPLNPSTCRF